MDPVNTHTFYFFKNSFNIIQPPMPGLPSDHLYWGFPQLKFVYKYMVIRKSLWTWWLQYSKVQLMIWRWPSQNTFGMRTVLYRTRSSRTQLGVSINVWRMAGDALNITCNFLYCNHQVHKDFLITLCNI
jgi:hypothetical protein